MGKLSQNVTIFPKTFLILSKLPYSDNNGKNEREREMGKGGGGWRRKKRS